jgi:hypothetical protein
MIEDSHRKGQMHFHRSLERAVQEIDRHNHAAKQRGKK